MNTGAEAVETALKAVVGPMMLKVLNQIKLRLLHLMGTSMVVQWPLCLYHLKLNINVDMVLY